MGRRAATEGVDSAVDELRCRVHSEPCTQLSSLFLREKVRVKERGGEGGDSGEWSEW